VVNPDDVSKNASTKDGIAPLNTNGNAPKNEITIQANPTVKNPSFAYISFFFPLIFIRIKAIGIINNTVYKNALASPCP